MGNPCETNDAKFVAVDPPYQRGQEIADTGIILGQDTTDVPGVFGLHLNGGNGTHLVVGTLGELTGLCLDLGRALAHVAGLRALEHLRRAHRRLGARLDVSGPAVWTVTGWRMPGFSVRPVVHGVVLDEPNQASTMGPFLFVAGVLPGDHAEEFVADPDMAPAPTAQPWVAAIYAPDAVTAVEIARHRAAWQDDDE